MIISIIIPDEHNHPECSINFLNLVKSCLSPESPVTMIICSSAPTALPSSNLPAVLAVSIPLED